MMKNILLLSVLSLLSLGLSAQNVTSQTIRWHIGETREISAGNAYEEADLLVSYGTTKIEWRSAAGVVKKSFVIHETNGSWSNVQTNGSILYEVSDGEQMGTVRIFRTADELTVRVTLMNGDSDPDLYEFSINSLETL